jgi:diguanylate cyclase (GGDEF)-like protein
MRMVKGNLEQDTTPPSATDIASAYRSGACDEPRISAEIWDAARRAHQSFLDALPIATAIVGELDGRYQLAARNMRFAVLERNRPGQQTAPILDTPAIQRQLAAYFAASGRTALSFEWRDGDSVAGRHFVVTIAPLLSVVDGPELCLLTLLDRTAEIENARSLRAELLHDSLTGLPNRSAFAEAVDEVVAAGNGNTHAVLLVDLARFSRINESLGGIAGDEVIITVARRLISTLRAGDMLARVGGDEFGILLRLGRGPDDAPAAAQRIHSVLTVPFRLATFEVGLNCAIGCAMIGDADQASGEELVRNAQFALKRAKASGRIEMHRAGEAVYARYRMDLETELRRAIEREELSLAFQPVIDLASGRCTGFEALARWRHPDRGTIDPSEFISVAEEAGLIVPLGRWAVHSALATLRAWDGRAGAPVPLSMSVNVSAIQLLRDDVAGMIKGALAVHGVAGDRLIAELTESAIVRDPERATEALLALKAIDVRVALDDFGTGYSSLTYLRKLPIDILKIDRSFVSGMLADRDKVAIVRAVLSLADALGKKTTAEGVETFELAQTLSALGCSHGQGYHYAMPLDADAAYEYWRAGQR